MGPNLLFDKLMSKIRHSQIGNLQVINSTPLGLPPLQTPQQEKVKVMGWSPTTFESDESLTARELGLALGNSGPVEQMHELAAGCQRKNQ